MGEMKRMFNTLNVGTWTLKKSRCGFCQKSISGHVAWIKSDEMHQSKSFHYLCALEFLKNKEEAILSEIAEMKNGIKEEMFAHHKDVQHISF